MNPFLTRKEAHEFSFVWLIPVGHCIYFDNKEPYGKESRLCSLSGSRFYRGRTTLSTSWVSLQVESSSSGTEQKWATTFGQELQKSTSRGSTSCCE